TITIQDYLPQIIICVSEILLHPHTPKGSSPDIVYFRKRSRSDKVLLIQSFSTSSDTTCEVLINRSSLAC
ncbi:hypothetical protein Tco_1454431, partial [Tanacetum coccineum]